MQAIGFREQIFYVPKGSGTPSVNFSIYTSASTVKKL